MGVMSDIESYYGIYVQPLPLEVRGTNYKKGGRKLQGKKEEEETGRSVSKAR